MNLAEANHDYVIVSQAVGNESASVRRKWREEIRRHGTGSETQLPSPWRAESFEAPIIVTVALEPSRLDLALTDVRTARSGRAAYDSFSRALSACERGEIEDWWPRLIDYLNDPNEPYRALLLSCLADHEVELSAPWVIRRLAELLSSSDNEIARSATLALLAGGELSSSKLGEEIERLHPVRRNDLRRLASLAYGIE